MRLARAVVRLAVGAALTLLLVATNATSAPGVRPDTTPDVASGESAALRVVRAAGSPEAMGRAIGTECAAAIRDVVHRHVRRLPAIARDPQDAVRRARDHAASMPDDQVRELRETARAAGVDEDWLFVAATLIEIVPDYPACAAVAAWGSSTADRRTIVGRNLDWPDYGRLHRHGLLVVRHPEGGRAFVSCGYPGVPGVVTGMNESGLFVADLMLDARAPPPRQPGALPVMSIQRLVLERCGTIDQALAMIRSAARGSPQSYILADRAGAHFVETDATSVRVRAPVGDTVVGTNWPGETRGVPSGDLRFARLCNRIDARWGGITPRDVEDALGAANKGPVSLMSVVAIPDLRRLRVSSGRTPACLGPFVEFDLDDLLRRNRR